MRDTTPAISRIVRSNLVSNWLSETVYYQQDDYFNDMLSSIHSSKLSIELETYIFQFDKVGKQVAAALIGAAARGVEVRVIVDGFGSALWIPLLSLFFLNTNVRFKVFNSLSLLAFKKDKFLRWGLIKQSFSQFNKRLHRKTCIIDGVTMFAGSFNISSASHRESGVQVTGEQVAEVSDAFNSIWENEPSNIFSDDIESLLPIRLNDTDARRTLVNKELIRRIRKAAGRVWVTSAYFVPPLFLLRALNTARKNNVDVTLIVPSRSSSSIMKLVMETYFSSLLRSGVKIFEYKKKFLHAKTLLIDDWSLVGSSNMNHRSLLHDLELGVVLAEGSSLLSMENKFLEDKSDSQELHADEFERRPIVRKAMGSFVNLFRNWL